MNDRTRNWLKALATPNKPDEYEAKQLLSTIKALKERKAELIKLQSGN